MSSAEVLDAVKKAARHNNEVALTIDSAVANRLLTDVDELFLILTRLFSPDSRGHLSALRAKKQRDNQPAAEYMKEVRDIGYVHWVGLPEKPETFDMIINNMSEKHRAFVRDKWNTMHVAMQVHDNPNPITFAHLMNWALDSDAEYTTNQQFKKTDNKNAGKANHVQGESDKDKRQFNDGRNHHYRGRGRGYGRGPQVNYNQGFQEKSPWSFMLQLHVSDEESESDSDMDVNICDLEPDTEKSKKKKIDPAVSEGFVPVEIVNKKFADYVPAPESGNVRKRKVTPLTPEAATATASDVLPVPPTPVGEQCPKLPADSMPLTENMFMHGVDMLLRHAATNYAPAARTPGPRKVIRKPRAAIKSRTSPRKVNADVPVKATRQKSVRKGKVAAVKALGNAKGNSPSAVPVIQTPPEIPSVNKGKRLMTPVELLHFDQCKKGPVSTPTMQSASAEHQVPVYVQQRTIHPTAFKHVPLYSDECWTLPLPDSTRLAERQKGWTWPWRFALFDPTIHTFDKPPYWPEHLPRPAAHTGWPSGDSVEPADVFYPNGMIKPSSADFKPVLQQPPN